MLSKYPAANGKFAFVKDFARFEKIKEMIRAVRNVRTEYGVQPSKAVKLYVITSEKTYLQKNVAGILRLANVSEMIFLNDKSALREKHTNVLFDKTELLIPLGDLVDFEKEILRLTKEYEATLAEKTRSEQMLANPGFVNKAPKHLIEKEQEKLALAKELAEKLGQKIEELKR